MIDILIIILLVLVLFYIFNVLLIYSYLNYRIIKDNYKLEEIILFQPTLILVSVIVFNIIIFTGSLVRVYKEGIKQIISS